MESWLLYAVGENSYPKTSKMQTSTPQIIPSKQTNWNKTAFSAFCVCIF